MRYLVTFKILPVPPAMAKTALALVEATKTWIEKEMKEGRIVEAWAYTEGLGGVALIESESNDALYIKLNETPFSPFMQFCVKPLTDINIQFKTAIEFYKQMAGA